MAEASEATRDSRSPYQLVLGDELPGLHPRLRAYFGAIPTGHVGQGRGRFSRVGTPRRILWPILAILQAEGILFPVWQSDVLFSVTNRSTTDPNGSAAVAASRTFELKGGNRTMVDAITVEGSTLVDYLGTGRRFRAELVASVQDGALRLRSDRMAVRLGGRYRPVPEILAPTVRLTERFDEATDRQHVSVVLESRWLGRIYEYSGSFAYEVVAERAQRSAGAGSGSAVGAGTDTAIDRASLIRGSGDE
ncbi:DUF4166 domain-containing protein [Naasia lichenicola]|uniref:DUF4166 domain-containing protein n=1 Tax=Naasia lichenicola TaxID=2565933 RepID=A0A4S4FU41_9MICO|nr:DUF4166 domain-containing protein [Naasia lichenicola]THG33512.1 DUF4166 domain-containing protein [Naasia lichenicola]